MGIYRTGDQDCKGQIRKIQEIKKKDNEKLKPLTVPLLAVHHYGAEHQKKKAIEEMGELITELEREQDGRTTPKKVITEIADVHLMIRQLMIIYGFDACMKEYDRKQRRLLRRMDKETGGYYTKNNNDGNKG